MFLQNQSDLIALLGIAACILLALSIIGGVLASLKSFQVRQFQDLLFKAERKIDNLERRMFNVLNAVPVALVETDMSGKFTFANKAAHQLLGRKDSELIGLRFHSATWGIAYPDGRVIPADLMPIARTLRGQTVKGFQHLLTNHGSHDKVLVSVTSMPIMNGNGEVIGSTSAMVEIETSSGEGVGDLNGLWRGHWFSSATVPFWGLDDKGRILDINPAALSLFGLKHEQALGQNWTQFFVTDSDFQTALDYLGETQSDAHSGNPKSLSLALKSPDGKVKSARVSAWAVRAAGEAGDQGLTVMALLDEANTPPALSYAPTAQIAAPAAPAMDPAEAQALEDYRIADAARSALGVGTWHYDAQSDSIVEDIGMRTLIGRAYDGGPTLITDEDQAVADAAFVKLMSGEVDHLSLDLPIRHRDGELHWITLKGEASNTSEGRRMFGIAYDSTDWKRSLEETETTAAPVVDALSQADLEAAVAAAREQARTETIAEMEAEMESRMQAQIQAAIEAAPKPEPEPEPEPKSDTVYGWTTPPEAPTPAVIPEPVIVQDPELIAENLALKNRLEQLQAMAVQASDPAHMQKRIDDLSAALIAARQYETVGRMTHDVAQDFAEMLGVINNALEVMARQSDNPESVRRLSEAALTAGKRGERLTRQLQALQSEENQA